MKGGERGALGPELLLMLVVSVVFVGGHLLLFGVARALDARLLYPFIGSWFLWLLAVLNIKDARADARTLGERVTNLTLATCFVVATVPLWWKQVRPPSWICVIFLPAGLVGAIVVGSLVDWLHTGRQQHHDEREATHGGGAGGAH